MTEDAGTKTTEESVASARAMRQRKKRRWDEPADFLCSTGISIPGTIPIGFGNTLGISSLGVFPLSNAIATNPVVPLITQSAATLVQKLSQPKVQDELIAREIVINDAEPTIRYKLTKRQTQEEIQRSTGAIVITRGKYRPPNALPDSEKPLYLHISAGSHLKDMAERIIAVDRAASMVEEILRQGLNLLSTSGPYTTSSSAAQVNLPLSTCLFLGFEPDPSQNIAARIRGPNDQYINHIINETGATVVLRGLGSGSHDISNAEDAQQPLHLYLSSTNSKSLEAARSLAENLLDTISGECGVSRVSSSKVYSAVPPPQQLLSRVVSSANTEVSVNPAVSSSCAVAGITQSGQSLTSITLVGSSVSTVLPSGVLVPNGNLASCGTSIPNIGSYAYSTATGGTFYSGYGGIYPQATPLQQVALALKHAPVSTTSVVTSTTSHANALPKMTSNSNADTEKRPPQKRKFQELPVTSKGPSTVNQNSRLDSECFKPGLEEDTTSRKLSTMPPPKELSLSFGELSPPPSRMMPPPPPPSPRELPPPPSRMMPPPPPSKLPSDHSSRKMPPPPPPKFPSSQLLVEEVHSQNPDLRAAASAETPVQRRVSGKATTVEPVSDSVLKLVEYEEEEEEDDMVASAEESCRSNIMRSRSSKPFWAV